MPVLTIRIVRDCIYLLISYSEKFSTRVRRLPYAVNVNLNLCNLDQKRIFQSGTLRPHGVDKCFSFNQFIPVFHVTMFPPSGLTCNHTSEKQGSARLGRLWIGALAKVHSTASSLAARFNVSYQTSLLSWWCLLWYCHSTSFTTIKYRILVIAKFVILGVFLFGEMIGFYGFYPFLQNVIKQVVCWRGHLTRVVGLEHVQSSGVIVSASTDCSVR